MNYSILKWIARGLMVALTILGCCYVFDLVLEGPSSIPVILISTVVAISILVVVFEFAIIIPVMKWTTDQKIFILRKREDDYEGYYAPETKPELPGGAKKRNYNRKPKSKTGKTNKTNKTTTSKIIKRK